jgi:4-hydroxybenzoate polyprenyltransferase/phosphoserine phosphatase
MGDLQDTGAEQAERSSLYVDLDGTLVRTDLFAESIFSAVKCNPWIILFLPFWLLRGVAYAKALTARYGRIRIDALPYDEDLIAYLQQQRAKGRRLILATASHHAIAARVARHLLLFDRVIATRRSENVKSRRKLERILEIESDSPFVYAGNSLADRPIWKKAIRGIYVRAPARDVTEALARDSAELVIPRSTTRVRELFRALRPHQWAKNVLIFLPLLTAHLYFDRQALLAALVAFIAYCLAASSSYVLNDMLDLDADRRHASKRRRPFAAGTLPLTWGAALVPGLALAAGLLAWLALPWQFLLILGLYYASTCLYSLWLKRVSTIDVITLAGLYTARVLGGAAAIAVAPSFWLLAFSMFLFLSLAYVKRYTELRNAEDSSTKLPGRGYSREDAESTFTLGSVSGVSAVLVMALFINSGEVRAHYGTPEVLWVICPALLYWINRIWIGARRGRINDDPVVFALTDSISLTTAAFCAAAIVAARLFQF